VKALFLASSSKTIFKNADDSSVSDTSKSTRQSSEQEEGEGEFVKKMVPIGQRLKEKLTFL
jgi:hypothetical protein